MANLAVRRGRPPRARAAMEDRSAEARGQRLDLGAVRQQFGLFLRMAKPYFRDERDAQRQLGTVLALTLLNSGVSVLFSFVGRDFWTALSAKDTAQFYDLMIKFAGALAIGTPIAVQYKFQRANLALSWRAWMTERLTDLYLSNRSFYNIDLDGGVDNPDQRLTEDVKYFTRVSLDFSITVRGPRLPAGVKGELAQGAV